MSLLSTPWDLISSIFIFFFGFLISINLSKYFKINKKRAIVLYIWHTIFCIIYVNYTIKNGGDAIWYYQLSNSNDLEFSFGTIGIIIITGFFTSILNLSLLGTFLAFNIFGYIGLISFDACLISLTREKTKIIRRLCTLIIFLPSISFWSSAIGKDALSFMAVGLLLWSTIEFKKRSWLLFFSIFIMLIVRPHIAAIIIISFIISLFFSQNISFLKRLIFGFIGIISAAALIPFAMNYTGLSQIDQLTEYIEQRQGYNQEGGGSVDISKMNTPFKLFTYLFRPLPFEANNIFSLAASFDNIIILSLFLFGFFSFIKHKKNINNNENTIFLWIYSISTWCILAFTTANLGISVRQKWMFTIILIYLLISLINNKNTSNKRKSNFKN